MAATKSSPLAGQHRAAFRGGGEQGGGLGRDHLQIMLFASRARLLADFSCITSPSAMIGGGAGQNVQHGEIAGLHHQLEGAARTGNRPPAPLGLLPHTRLAETLPRRSALSSTTSSCSRVAVWMNSTAAARLDMAVAAIAAGLGGGQGQHRPQPLAAGIDQMPRQVGDQLATLDAMRLWISRSVASMSAADQGMQPLDRGNRRPRPSVALFCQHDMPWPDPWPAEIRNAAPARSSGYRHRGRLPVSL